MEKPFFTLCLQVKCEREESTVSSNNDFHIAQLERIIVSLKEELSIKDKVLRDEKQKTAVLSQRVNQLEELSSANKQSSDPIMRKDETVHFSSDSCRSSEKVSLIQRDLIELSKKVDALSTVTKQCFHVSPPSVTKQWFNYPPPPLGNEKLLPQPLRARLNRTQNSSVSYTAPHPVHSEGSGTENYHLQSGTQSSASRPPRGNRIGRNRNRNVIKSSNIPSESVFSHLERLN